MPAAGNRRNVPPPQSQPESDVTDLDRRALVNRIDRLIAPWNGDLPGITVGVVQGGELVAHRHAGLASLELGVRIGPETCFRIASVSKQFTCAAVLILAARGLLDIEAPARTLLPELPEAYAAVTVAHLMQNTSGIRDMLEIQRQGGADLGTSVSAEDLLDGICRQATLNFAPGTRYLYSNSAFFLLGLIVERLTGRKLEAVLEEEIFVPLGMTSTRHTPDLSVPIPNLATGYLAKNGGFVRASHGFALGGEGGLVSCVGDLALWARTAVLRRHPAGGVLDALEKMVPFTNGRPSLYARGLLKAPYRGVLTFSHGGLWPGYRTEYLRAPSLDAAVIAISNNGAADPNLIAHRVLDVLLDRTGAVKLPKLPPAAELAPVAGRYLDPETGATVDVSVSEEGVPTLKVNGLPSTAEATEDGRLAIPRSSTVFSVRAKGPDAVEVTLDAGTVSVWNRVPPGAVLPADLPGTYASEEMASRWVIERAGEGMRVRVTGPVVRGARWEIEPIAESDVRVHVPGTLMRGWLDARVERDAGGAIAALVVNGGRAKRVRYARRPDAPASPAAMR